MAGTRVPAPATLVALLAVVAMAATATGAVADNSTTICDTANKCGKGRCSEVPLLLPGTAGYNCTCDPGWSQKTYFPILDWLPCMVPDCSISSGCLNFNLTMPPWPGIPLTEPCVFVDCGQGGACEKGAGISYQCRCNPGFTNLLNMTSMPCIGGSCTFGPDCAKLGLGNTSTAPAPAPIGNGDLY